MFGRALAAVLTGALLTAIGHRPAQAQDFDHFGLMLVWMPGLCKLEPDRTECKDLTLKRYDGHNLAFMSLEADRESNNPSTFCFTMPSDSEMDRQRQWCDMDKETIRDDLQDDLKELMPISQSCQDRGLWSRYASCTLYSADDYYERGFKLTRAIATTQMNAQIVAAAGTIASQRALVAAFQADFGDDAGSAVDFICRDVEGKSHLVQVKITLAQRALLRGLDKDLFWVPHHGLRRSCPENIVIDAPPGDEPAAKSAAPAPAPEKPAAPDEPPPPESAPVGPVQTAPLDGPEEVPMTR
jgi:ribonuclease I